MYAYPIKLNGITYKSARQCCIALDIDYVNVQQYARRKRISMKEAIIKYMQGGSRSIVFDGVLYSNKKECCDKLGLKYSNVQRYKEYHNMSWEMAITHYIKKSEQLEKEG